MPTSSSGRRTQVQRRESTVAALIAAARTLFAEDGYGSTSLEAIAAQAGVTKGALYHHFAGKRELFRAVYEHEQQRIIAALQKAYLAHEDPWAAVEAAAMAFLNVMMDPATQRISLLDATGALGWEAVREIESPVLMLTELAIRRAIEAGQLRGHAAAPLAQLLFGAMCEGAMNIARAEDPGVAKKAMATELSALLRSLS